MSSNNYVVLRGTKYYYRRRVPADLLDHYSPKQEFLLSLKTSERREAEIRARAKSVEHDKEFEQIRLLRQTPFLSAELESHPPPPESTVEAVTTREVTGESRRQILSGDAPSFETLVAVEAADQLARLKREILQARLMEELPFFMGMERLRFDSNRAALEGREQSEYPLWKLKAIVLAQQEILEPGQHLPIKWLEKALQAAPMQAAAPEPNQNERVSLEELVQLWKNDRNPTNTRTVFRANRVVREFVRLQGNLPLHAITRRHCIAFRDSLRAEDQSIPNTNIYTNMLSALFSVAFSRDLMKDNPAKGLTLKDPTPKGMKRKPFDVDALTKVFTSPVYTEGMRQAGGAGEAAYWLPLIALFTGARLEELGQLAPQDVREDDYEDENGDLAKVWIINVTNEGEGQRLKNEGSRRRIPIHSELIRLGFIEFVQARKDKSRIFFELNANKHGQKTSSWSKWFGRFLRGTCNITDEKIVFHSFRHTFKDWCREAGIEQQWHDKLTGHAGNSVGDIYGAPQAALRQLTLAMRKIKPPKSVQTVLNALPQFRA